MWLTWMLLPLLRLFWIPVSELSFVKNYSDIDLTHLAFGINSLFYPKNFRKRSLYDAFDFKWAGPS
jgi:hypothetical protein